MRSRSILLLLSALSLVAIVHAKTEQVGKPLAPGMIRLTPIDMFPGDLKRLQPHLEISGVCYKVEYNGPEIGARFVLEEWKRGKREGYASIGMELKASVAGEASISIKPAHDDDGNPASRVITSVFGPNVKSSGAISYPKPQAKGTFKATKQLDRVRDLSTDKDIPLWAELHYKKGVGVSGDELGADDFVQELKEVEYAIVWKLVAGGKE